jgi:maltose O-acetyltransferase
MERLRRSGLVVGENVFIGGGTFLDPDFTFLIRIGDRTTLSVGVTVLAHDASTRLKLGYSRVAPVAIGDRVFIGARAVILPGVTIGDDAIVGAGSVVTRDIPPAMVAVGNPARVVGTVEEYLSRNRELLERRPTWEREGWTVSGGITPEHAHEMHEALSDGEAFIR